MSRVGLWVCGVSSPRAMVSFNSSVLLQPINLPIPGVGCKLSSTQDPKPNLPSSSSTMLFQTRLVHSYLKGLDHLLPLPGIYVSQNHVGSQKISLFFDLIKPSQPWTIIASLAGGLSFRKHLTFLSSSHLGNRTIPASKAYCEVTSAERCKLRSDGPSMELLLCAILPLGQV